MRQKLTLLVLLIAVTLINTGNCYAGPETKQTDSVADVEIYFRFDRYTLDSAYMSNSSTLKQLKQLLSDKNIVSRMDSMVIHASSSPEGAFDRNAKLSKERAKAVKGYILNKYPEINPDKIITHSTPENWSGLNDLVRKDMQIPFREKVLEVIAQDVNPETKEWRLKQIGGGISWQYIEKYCLRHLRTGATCVLFYKKEEIEGPVDSIQKPGTPVVDVSRNTQPNQDILPTPIPLPSPVEYIRKPLFAIKSNLLFDALTILNVELEVPVGKRWSVAGEWIFPWWNAQRADWTMQLLSGHGSVKYWFGDREKKAVLTGFSLGLFGGGGKYDYQFFNKNGEQGNFLDAGLSGGFAHQIGKHFRMEYALGVGVAGMNLKKYDKVNNTEYGDIKVFRYPWETKRRVWIGPTQAKISLVWLLDYKTKKKGAVK